MIGFVCFLSALLLIPSSIALIGCRDESNNIVDFVYLYKLPEDPPAQTAYKSDGYRYAYMTSLTNSAWIDSSRNISKSESIPGLTLSQMYQNSETLAILYNDQTPTSDPDDASKGHSKGVVVTDGVQGYWIIHSIPRFPPVLSAGTYDYPATGAKYGQNYLCVTMNATEIDKAVAQLITNQVQVYSSRSPTSLRSAFPNAVRLLDGVNVLTLTSVGGVPFKSFAKSSTFNRDLYQDLVAPTLQTDISVESWKFGTNFLYTNCSTPQTVFTVSKIEIIESDYRFSTTRDHSKWAVSASPVTNWICIGDINRFESQFKRGGGTLCQNAKVISDAYRRIISETDLCKSK